MKTKLYFFIFIKFFIHISGMEKNEILNDNKLVCDIILKLNNNDYSKFILSDSKTKLKYVFSDSFLEKCYSDDIFNLTNLDLIHLHNDVYKCTLKVNELITTSTLVSLFFNKKNIISINGIENIFDISKVENMSFLFADCHSLMYINDLSKWDMSSVTDTTSMFRNCYSLLNLNGINNWNFKEIKYMSNMFIGCFSLTSIPDISRWNVANVKEFCCMFSNCRSLCSLPNISTWNVKNIEDIFNMFNECVSLVSLPNLSPWSIENIYLNKIFCKNSISLLNNDINPKKSNCLFCSLV